MSKKLLLLFSLGVILVLGVFYIFFCSLAQKEESVTEQQNSVDSTDVEAPMVYENWDHISNSASKYLIWSGKELAMVENCPGGYEEAYGKGSEVWFCKDWDNRWLQFEDLYGTEFPVSIEAGNRFLMDWRNIGGSSFQQTMSPDEKYWIYLDTWSGSEDRLMVYNIEAATEKKLMSFLAVDRSDDMNYCSDVRFFGWSLTHTGLGIVVMNRGADDSYPEDTKLFILTIEGGELTGKKIADIPVVTNCSSNNGPGFAIAWVDDDTVGYYDSEDDSDGNGVNDDLDDSASWNIFSSENPWNSDFVHYYEVE